MSRLIDLTGQRFGRLTVRARSGSSPRGIAQWECLCDCGSVSVVHGSDLRSGHTTSCACERAAFNRRVRTTHGLAPCDGTPRHELYETWCGMKQRCLNPNNHAYRHYGGRGIKVCVEWLDDFEQFIADMGPRPTPKHSIDRIDNDGNYEPGNCRWATAKGQANNRGRRYAA